MDDRIQSRKGVPMNHTPPPSKSPGGTPSISANGAAPCDLPFDPAAEPIWEAFDRLLAQVPPEELSKLPLDGAENHDHYIYGLAKRTP